MQIEQRRVIPQTVLYSIQETGNKKYYRENKDNLKNGKVRFRLNIEVTKEKEDSWLNAIRTNIAYVKDRLNFSSKSTTAANAHHGISFR